MPDASGGPRGPEPRTVAFVYLAGLVQGVVMVSFAASSAVLRGRHGFSDTEYGSIFLPQVALAALGAIGSGAVSRVLDLRHVLALSFAAMALSQAALAGSHFVAGVVTEGLWLLFPLAFLAACLAMLVATLQAALPRAAPRDEPSSAGPSPA